MELHKTELIKESKQGQIHGNPVADGWVGAVLQQLVGIRKCNRPT